MKLKKTRSGQTSFRSLPAVLLLFSLASTLPRVPAQSQAGTVPSVIPDNVSLAPSSGGSEDVGFRIEKVPVAGGSELITIFAKIEVLNDRVPDREVPLISIVRDTLGDDKPENDRLRYLWMLSYTRPTLTQRLSAFVPFLYTRTTNKKTIGSEAPPSVLDLQASDRVVWNKVLWIIFKKLIVSETGLGIRASALQYRQNSADYRKAAVAGALTILSLYQDVEGEKVLSESELKDIQARLTLADKTFGWHMQSENLGRVYERDLASVRDYRGHNWELLRQTAESQGLYFEPLEMPDGTSRHAIVWASTADIAANKNKKFDGRFLNIRNPWTDDNLAEWKGYSQTRWFDADDRPVEPDTANARSKTMIPLALYGLDHPKIPVILVDFRDNANPKKREMSKRILNDITGDVLGLSRFGGVPFLLGKFIFDFATGRRGMDLNGASRLRAYTQLKLLLSLDDSLDRPLHDAISSRIESAALNPLGNDTDVEIKLAQTQYENLIAYAKRPDGLPAKIMQDRREEMTRLKHGRGDRTMFAMAHFFSFGQYTHREDPTSELLAQMDIRRQLDYHERFLKEVAFASVDPAIDCNVNQLKRSLLFIAQNGSAAEPKTTRALGKIFAVSDDEDIRSLCLTGMYRVNNSAAKKELLSIYNNPNVDDRWRNVCAHYLKLALQEGQRISERDAETIVSIDKTAN